MREEIRPGFGGSTGVKVDQRVSTWLEAVPAVLGYLKVKNVAVVSHSAGTIYAINTVVRLSHLLCPERSFVACFGESPPYLSLAFSVALLLAVACRFWDLLEGYNGGRKSKC